MKTLIYSSIYFSFLVILFGLNIQPKINNKLLSDRPVVIEPPVRSPDTQTQRKKKLVDFNNINIENSSSIKNHIG